VDGAWRDDVVAPALLDDIPGGVSRGTVAPEEARLLDVYCIVAAVETRLGEEQFPPERSLFDRELSALIADRR
jgi:hypothetical protein